jgi:Ca-activated chloride channel family protein
LTGFHLMRPEWLWCLLPAVILTALLWRQRGRSGSWSAVIDPDLLTHLVPGNSGGRTRNLLPLLLTAWVLAVVAASGPSFQQIPQPVHQKQDALVLVLDLSYSMKSGDLSPSRIDRARQKLLDLLERRDEGQTGLIAYAGDAHIVTPLTDDTRTIANLLPALNPDMMPLPGSDPVAALEEAISLLDSAGIKGGRILLVTDSITASERDRLADTVSGSGANLSIMGVGTTAGAPIPLPGGGFVKDESGAIVMPALDDAGLLKAASATGGRYLRMQIDDSDLEFLLAEEVLPLPGESLAVDRSADTWEDQGYLLLILVLPIVLSLFRRGWVACLLPLLLLGSPERARADLWEDLWFTPDQQGQRALQRGEPEAAATLFEDPEWAGTANYLAGDYRGAQQAFSQQDSADSWYNRGNALARAGQFREAINAYRESLARQPDQSDALENIALLEKLQQRQQQDQQQEQEEQGQQSREQQSGSQGGDDKQPQNHSGETGNGAQNQADNESASQEPGAQGSQAQEPEERPGQQSNERQAQGEQQPADAEAAQDARGDGQQAQAMSGAVDPEQQERDQAMEQWLRRVPDDPSGLLREKFRYHSQQRQRGESKRNAQYW